MLFFAPPAPPVSFSAQVAPILAMRCNSCHGEAGRLDTRTHAGLMAGGNLGKVVIPGDSEGSLLVHFIDGRRGEERRMPLGGHPLSADEIRLIRRWIDEGAKADPSPPPARVMKLNRVRLPRGAPMRFYYQVPVNAYVTLAILDPASRRVLLSRVAAVKADKEQADAGSPGELLHWEIRAERGWPVAVDAELTIEHAAGDLEDARFYASTK